MPTTIQSLPVELITRIIVLGSNYEYPYTDSPFLFKPVQNTFYNSPSCAFQIVVSHVCHTWREIALRTACLWTTLHFHEPAHIQRARVFLSRSRPQSSSTLDILISTVSEPEYIPNVNLYLTELRDIFQLIVGHVKRWRSFHLKIRDNQCKLVARQYLSSCGPGPNLETLQLYHFEDFENSADLYLATYRPPVIIFNNEVPKIKNVSLIGVNLPWDQSPYLESLRSLELALHADNIRPPYVDWEHMLRSPDLERLSLHYSGPRSSAGDAKTAWPTSLTWPVANRKGPVVLERLTELGLMDLEPEYLGKVMQGVVMTDVTKLSLNLSEQDYSPFLGSLTRREGSKSSRTGPPVHYALPNIHLLTDLTVTALECSVSSFRALLRILVNLRFLDVDFAGLCGGEGWKVFVEDDDPEYEHDEEKGGSEATRSSRRPTPEQQDLIVDKKNDLEWDLPQGPLPRPLSMYAGMKATGSSLVASTSAAEGRSAIMPSLLPNLDTFRALSLDGSTLRNVIASRGTMAGKVNWIIRIGIRYRDIATSTDDSILDGIIRTGECPLEEIGIQVPVHVDWVQDDEEEEEEEEEEDGGDDLE
ncbi:uncharacterized protein BT62DRAFT_996261 [Guyanagaster necrorhizus]|uniref:F-box domain-containing protein n=1 Tax=Guyanagaster necrorhizus TaxID=856835 RepID=A0A9P7VL49_9AGAR|nr:uncharacterized protein BT62DRAFT_996261 [Guyanagaster necrorhizus MCA 3950]KAG7443131.1 hypothetical protein BT62DRAFT_996261 [Guyanagaster necrorhizus MCA 3950]